MIVFMILVSVEAIIFTKELTDLKVNQVGIKVTFECELSKRGLKVDWYKGMKKLRRDERYDVKSEGKEHRLIIEKISAQDIGEYRAEYQTLTTAAKLSVEGKICLSCLQRVLFCYCSSVS